MSIEVEVEGVDNGVAVLESIFFLFSVTLLSNNVAKLALGLSSAWMIGFFGVSSLI